MFTFKKKKTPSFFSSWKHGLEHIPACLQARGGVHLREVSVHQRASIQRQTAICTDIHTQGQFKLAALPIHSLWTVGGSHSAQRGPQSTGWPCKRHTKKSPGLQGIQTFFCDSAVTVCTDVCYLIFVNLRQSRLSNSLPLKLWVISSVLLFNCVSFSVIITALCHLTFNLFIFSALFFFWGGGAYALFYLLLSALEFPERCL